MWYNYTIHPVDWKVKWVSIHILADGADTLLCGFALGSFHTAAQQLATSCHFNKGSVAEEKQFWPQQWEIEEVANMSKCLKGQGKVSVQKQGREGEQKSFRSLIIASQKLQTPALREKLFLLAHIKRKGNNSFCSLLYLVNCKTIQVL